jgi:hypothetical protein
MSVLREQIASMIDNELHGYGSYGTALGIADAIMALPQIADALAAGSRRAKLSSENGQQVSNGGLV